MPRNPHKPTDQVVQITRGLPTYAGLKQHVGHTELLLLLTAGWLCLPSLQLLEQQYVLHGRVGSSSAGVECCAAAKSPMQDT